MKYAETSIIRRGLYLVELLKRGVMKKNSISTFETHPTQFRLLAIIYLINFITWSYDELPFSSSLFQNHICFVTIENVLNIDNIL